MEANSGDIHRTLLLIKAMPSLRQNCIVKDVLKNGFLMLKSASEPNLPHS
jgi:hypothetical protein